MSLWSCPTHGLYGGDIFCPTCGGTGAHVTVPPEDLMDTQAERLMELLAKATKGPWELQDGCSWRRIGTREGDGNVLCPDTYSREDRHPDLTAGRGENVYANLRLIVEGINALPALLTERASLLARVDELEKGLEPQPMETAPKDGTMIWLLVDYSGDGHNGDHPLADAGTAWTIGFNNLEADGWDQWKFAGWCWTHDHFTEGNGYVLAWKPLGFELDADDPARSLLPDAGEGG